MHDKKLIKKIFSLARYDFIQNFNNWVFITGIIAAVMTIVFALLGCITQNYNLHLWKLPTVFLTDCQLMLKGLNNYLSISFVTFDQYGVIQNLCICIVWLIKHVAPIAIFVSVVKNCLDLAFDSKMSGFGFITQLSFFWVIGQYILLSYLQGLLLLPLSFFMLIEWLQNSYLNYIVQALKIIYVIYVFQFLYMWRMHILEYQKGFWQSQKEIFQIAYNNRLLFKILLLQICAGGVSIAGIYFLLDPVIKVFLRFVFWPSTLMGFVTSPFLRLLASNFIYAWSYVLVYAWICLVLAHLYRQLVCPPVDNPNCLSCSSCPKSN